MPLLVFYETQRPVTAGRELSSGVWNINQTSTNDEQPHEDYNLHIIARTKIEYQIFNLNDVLLFKMLPLLTVSLLILVAVLLVFYLTIKNLERQAEEAAALHDQVDTISHEFKTPVATLKFGIKNLMNTNPENTTNLDLLYRQVGRLETLLHQLHEEESAQQPFSVVATTLWLEDFKKAHTSLALHWDIAVTHLPAITQNEVETLLSNILDNALKYGGQHIEVQLKTTAKNALNIKIKDDGIGIAPHEQAKIFDKFYRISTGNLHVTKGLGVGLYIVKQIVEKYGGSVVVESVPKVGTTFKINL
ncbi:sensor histidine kinase [Riemerella columbina]|uniref:sensor histidine kinase n=1 Tax=Riemerella columbina TaxID=103810 RepID=UPI00266EED5C|nr:HAMP domain-containing sensor histidine kinase [Riemerella columbina]WKS95504.1 HAMP domain-containing histidine kinase [Riemerella columbina]